MMREELATTDSSFCSAIFASWARSKVGEDGFSEWKYAPSNADAESRQQSITDSGPALKALFNNVSIDSSMRFRCSFGIFSTSRSGIIP